MTIFGDKFENAPKAPSFARHYKPAEKVPQAPPDAPVMHKVMRAATVSATTPYRVMVGLAPSAEEFEANLVAQAQWDIMLGRYSATEAEVATAAATERSIFERSVHDTLCHQWELILQGSILPPARIPNPPDDFVAPFSVTSGPRYDPTRG